MALTKRITLKFHQNVRDEIEKKNWDRIEISLIKRWGRKESSCLISNIYVSCYGTFIDIILFFIFIKKAQK